MLNAPEQHVNVCLLVGAKLSRLRLRRGLDSGLLKRVAQFLQQSGIALIAVLRVLGASFLSHLRD